MRRLVLLLIVAGVGLLAYREYQARRAPLVAFESFADEMVRGRPDFARRFAVSGLEALENGERFALASFQPVEAILGIRYTVDEQSRSADGSEVTLKVTQVVGFDPPGTISATRGVMKATFRQVAVLRSTPEGWKVASFKSELIDADSTR